MPEPTAYVTVENGQTVLHDPDTEGLIAAVEQHNREIAYEGCQEMFNLNTESIERFKRRFAEKSYDPKECCIVIIQVDDPYGRPISDILMPNEDWQAIRAQGLDPVARGIAKRDFMRHAISEFDQKAASDNDMLQDDLVAIVVANQVARVFPV